jgi:hypothetical protein
MHTPESSLEALANRVATLELQNRRLKKAGIASLVLIAAVIAMGQVQASRTLEANEFALKDGAGKARARLYMFRDRDPTLSLYDTGGVERVRLSQGKDSVSLTFSNNLPERYGGLQLLLTPESSSLMLAGMKQQSVISLSTLSPALNIHDSEGYEALVGVMETEFPKTGGTHKTSAASITLIGKDREVLWSAP